MPTSADGRGEPRPDPRSVSFTQEKPAGPEWFVSYAWGDDTPEGHAREAIVDRLCAAATANGHRIERDKDVLQTGDSISKFMRRIGAGDRVFVILSEKYLRSPFCMFELSEVWRMSRMEVYEFVDRVRVYTMPGTKIWTSPDRSDWAIHWKTQHDELDGRTKPHGNVVLGQSGYRELALMRRFYTQVADILYALANRVQPKTFEDLERYGFQDRPN